MLTILLDFIKSEYYAIKVFIITLLVMIILGIGLYYLEKGYEKRRQVQRCSYEKRIAKLKSIKIKVEIIAYTNKTHLLWSDETYTIVKLDNGKIKEIDRIVGAIGDIVSITAYDLE